MPRIVPRKLLRAALNLPELANLPDFAGAPGLRHQLLVLPAGSALPADLPGLAALQALLARRGDAPGSLAKTPRAAAVDGRLLAWVMLDPAGSVFEQNSLLRQALALLLEECPGELLLTLCGAAATPQLAEQAGYVALVNGVPLPKFSKTPHRPLTRVVVTGVVFDPAPVRAAAAGNLLARTLTALPPNRLAPGAYVDTVRRLARDEGWNFECLDFKALKKMGAGAFVAVAQGSPAGDAAIIRLRYTPSEKSMKTRPRSGFHGSAAPLPGVALVGKGICYDTGGHNLKPARGMIGMHEDMAGSAVALGILLAVSRQQLPQPLEVWLAVASNHLAPAAYVQGDVLTALDGTSIEVVHTDAEGRLVLADTLTLAARETPALLVDFATLTGSMVTALGTRQSGIFASSPALAAAAVAAGQASGERVVAFPLDADYDAALESTVADVKQCTLDGEADHILAARFLQRFTAGRPWLHMDLAAANCKGGLGATASDLTGFGVAWGLALLQQWSANAAGAVARKAASVDVSA